jgi:hypothetical protein
MSWGLSVTLPLYHLPSSPRTVNLSSAASYAGPSYKEAEANPCPCNTVVYSLLSGCGACQGGSWISYVLHQPLAYWDHIFSVGLSTILPAAQALVLPRRELTVVSRGFLVLIEKLTPSYGWPVPNGTSVPFWALIDVTVR